MEKICRIRFEYIRSVIVYLYARHFNSFVNKLHVETQPEQQGQVKTLEERLSVVEEESRRQDLYSKYEMMQEAWVKSKTHIFLVTTTTYAFVALFMYFLGVGNVLVNALLPAGAYILSQMSIPFIKRAWIKLYLKEQSKKTESRDENKPSPVFEQQTEPQPSNPHVIGKAVEQSSIEDVQKQ